jgi:predicted dehydrogenase/threonine dehydrogenase-like Zn-dependent dehydrogenase
MKQVVQDLRSDQPEVLEVPVPSPAPGTALIRTKASFVSAGTERTVIEFASKGMIGKARARPDLVRQTIDKVRQDGLLSTLQAVRSRLDQPLPLGYSSAGVIEQVGEGITDLRPGDRVACAGGHAVHAEFAVVPGKMIARLPESVDFESGAAATLGSIALHAFRLAEVQVGERVAVIGLGLLGQLALQIARAAGCEALGVDIDAARVELARGIGGSAANRDQAVEIGNAITGNSGFDAILICAHTDENDPLELAAELARDRATVILVGVVGMEIPRKPYYDKELKFVVSRSYGPGRYDPTYEEAGIDYPIGYVRWTEGRNIQGFLELVSANKVHVAPLVTHRFPLEKAEEAYQLIAEDSEEPTLGVLLTYADDAPKERKLILSDRVRRDSTVRLGALGAGNFARNVTFPVLKGMKDVELVGLATGAGVSAVDSGKRNGFTYAATDASEIFHDDTINTVAVLTRHHLHAEQTAAALSAGKHVFCEKPLAINMEGLEGVVDTLNVADGLLTVGFNRRFAPMAIQMRDYLSQAGEPLSVHYRVNAGPLASDHWAHDPAQGGGRIIGEACHFIDYLTFLMGALPGEVRAESIQGGQGENAHIVLRFPNGSVGTIDYLASGDRAFPKERVEAFGGGRVAALDDFRSLELVSGSKSKRSSSGQDKGHQAIWQVFVAAVRQGSPPPIPYHEIVGVTQATFAVLESLRSGQSIKLEPILGADPQ